MSTLINCQNPASSLVSLFDDFWNCRSLDTSSHFFSAGNMPKVDIKEEKNQFILKADLPGMEKKDVRISIDNGDLKIEGEYRNELKKDDGRYHYFERCSGGFSRSFVLPEGVESDKIKATMKNGVLELILPKNEKAHSKAIEVKVL